MAPIIEFLINLVYKLMKAIQSLVYAFSGINIFAKATASSMNKTASSASKAKKSLAGVHNEINNVSDNDNGSGSGSSTPSIDLSKVEDVSSSILDAISSGNWYEVGFLIGNKLNEALSNIEWGKIQEGAKNVASNIAEFINGFIEGTDWKKVGKTIGEGINTAIDFTITFIRTTDWNELGNAIGTTIGKTIVSIDWKEIGLLLGYEIPKALSEFAKGIGEGIAGGIFDGISNWIIENQDGLGKIIWAGIIAYIKKFLGINSPSTVARDEIGVHISGGILEGIKKGFENIGTWLYTNIIKPMIEAFCNLLGIHSPSTVFKGLGENIMQGLLNGISSLVGKTVEIFSNIKTSITKKVSEIKDNIKNKFQEAYNSIKNIFNNIGTFFSNVWSKVKNTFSKLGTNIGNAISNSVKSGINGVISMIQNTINRAIGLINGAIKLINKMPGVNINTISTLSLPRLATGNVAYGPMIAEFGEYAGARNNPEITTPQNIMRETFADVLSDYQFTNGNRQPIRVQIFWGAKAVVDEIIDGINEKTRQTGKAQIKVAYD